MSEFSKDSVFHHLSCFAGGMFSYGSYITQSSHHKEEFEIGKNLTKTCMDFYRISETGLGGEAASVQESKIEVLDHRYFLRPEVIESVFYLWRLTKEPVYRNFGKTMIENLEKNCRYEAGYHTLESFGVPSDKMESFFIAETLKYLFLLFSDDSVVSRNLSYNIVDEYVFNTEAHPLAIRGYGQRKDSSKWVKIKNTDEYLLKYPT